MEFFGATLSQLRLGFATPQLHGTYCSLSLLFSRRVPYCSVYPLQTSAYDVDMASLWSEHFYRGPASQLCFHPTKTLLAVASANDRAVHVINFHNSMGDFVVCGVGVAPPGQGGVNGLM